MDADEKGSMDGLAVNDRYELGSYLHTALRKVCDNTITSLAYNLVGMEGMSGAWKSYLEAAWRKLQGVESETALVVALREAAEELEWGDRGRNALRCCFRLFSDDDFLRMGLWVLRE